MDADNLIIEDGEPTQSPVVGAPSIVEKQKPASVDGNVKKKRRRANTKRKVMTPFVKAPWRDRRRNEKPKRNNRFRKIVLTKTHAPFNNNQFLMEIHKPEPENAFNILQTPSARTRDSSFSVDSDDNYFYALPEDEEEYLTKEFSSVYEDAQCERLSNMTKNELIQEYLLLEAKFENLVKRTERSKMKRMEEDKDNSTDRDASIADKDSMVTDRDTSETSVETFTAEDPPSNEIWQRLKDQEDQIRELQISNEKLLLENEHLRQRQHNSSEDSESDSSSTSDSNSSSGSEKVVDEPVVQNEPVNDIAQPNGCQEFEILENPIPLMNGFHTKD